MPKIKVVEIGIEDLTEAVAAFMMTRVWAMAEGTGVCPICLMECMYDMMLTAQEKGDINHRNVEQDTMGEPPVKTRQ